MGKTIDRISDACGVLAAVLFFVIGGMISYEVVARYLFNAPTIWSEEMSRFAQIWATYLAAAYVLRHRELIAVTLLVERLGPRGRRLADAFSLLAILAFSAVVIVYGAGIARESWEIGRATSTMLAVPKWMTESAIPVGFGLLAVQALVALARLARPGAPAADGGGDRPAARPPDPAAHP